MNEEVVRFRCRRGVAGLTLALGVALGCAPASAQSPVTVRVSGFQVTGNTLLDPKALDAVLLPMLGQRTIEELHRAAGAVQALYAAEGWGAVVAYVPPQSGEGGLVTIAVVEGKVSAIKVVGAQRTSEQGVKDSLPALQLGTTPRVTELDAQLRIANENPGKQVQVLLKPGRNMGEAEAELVVTEQPAQRFTAGLDNTGNSRTGDYRASLGWQHASITGHDDVLAAQVQFSPTEIDKVRVLSAGYRWPLYRQRVVLDVFAAYSDVDGGSSASLAGDLRFVGRGRVLGGRAAWYLPRWGDFDPRVALGIDRRAYLNRCDIDGLPSGACGPAGESVAVTPLSLEALLLAPGAVPASISLSLQHNLKLGGTHTGRESFEAARRGAKQAYTALRWALAGGIAFDEQWLLRGRLTGQWSASALVSGEQFGIGGAQSVRGYEERELIGDQGLAVTAELTGPALFADLSSWGSLRPLAFVDAGLTRNQGDQACADVRTQCTAASVGFGLRYLAGPLSARLDLAYPLKAAVRTQRGDTKAHVALQVGF